MEAEVQYYSGAASRTPRLALSGCNVNNYRERGCAAYHVRVLSLNAHLHKRVIWATKRNITKKREGREKRLISHLFGRGESNPDTPCTRT